MSSARPTREAGPGKVSSGIPGLDDVLDGGFPAQRVHLIEGTPGTGKTTIGLRFLLDGVARGEPVLYITLSETIDELRAVVESHGWSLDGVVLHELAPDEGILKPDEQYTILHPAEVELGETTWAVLEEVERAKPTRVVFDSLAELRLLARDQLRYRRQILALKQFFAGRHCTVLLLDGTEPSEAGLESIAHSVLRLEQLAPDYGAERRRLKVLKLRGGTYRSGFHDFAIRTGGITVFPRLVAADHLSDDDDGVLSSGLPELDHLLGGGLPRGTSALLLGPAGVGKSVIATQYAVAAAERGESATVYTFDETASTAHRRACSLGIDLASAVASGRVTMRQLDPGHLSPGEFNHLVQRAVEVDTARLIVIDSLNGYLNAMAEERAVIVQLHELLTYLGQQGVVTLITVAQHGLIGDNAVAPIDASYIADTVLLLRYFESHGELRQAISAVKKRVGGHERSIRELRIGPGIRVGEPLRGFQGVLGRSPTFVGLQESLFGDAPNGG
ncbi:MAG TPA: ATPase domain-containing protein [Thermomicrobiaceae bacterium]|nr:ATPase domain-containing protein [Thermomicrobiaceae bacterium]